MGKKTGMKVLIVNALFHPYAGGVEKHAVALAAELARQGVDVHVLTGRIAGTKAEEEYRGISIHRIACTELRVPGYYPPPLIVAPKFNAELAALDKRFKFDAIHLQDRWFPDFNSAVLYAQQAGKPAIVTLHNARPVGIAPHYTVIGGLYDALVGKRVLQKADRIISVSRWSAVDIQEYGIPAGKIAVIHNGIDTKEFRPRKGRTFRNSHGIRGPMLLFVGRVIRQKGLDFMLSAMPAVLKRHPGTKLVVIGRGNRLAHIKRMTALMGLKNQVVFPGFVGEGELKSALAECDVFVLPSLWEVLPVSILEAMACGRPVVCTDAGGNSELVETNYNGIVVPKRRPAALASAINHLLDNPKMAGAMGASGRHKAIAEFSWKTIAAKTIELYKQEIKEFRNKPKVRRSALQTAVNRLSLRLSTSRITFGDYLKSLAGQWRKTIAKRER